VLFRSEEVFNKIETLKAILGQNRDALLSMLVIDHFKKVITSIAVKEGVAVNQNSVGKQKIELKREYFAHDEGSCAFDHICATLNLKGTDGENSSIMAIELEVKKASVLQS
jgi:hypothetical protein